MAAATKRDARVARVIDREVAPVWHDRFARMIYRELPMSDGSFVLDIHCGSGRTTSEILQRMDAKSRVLAIEDDENLIGLAKTRVKPEWKRRVYFKPGDFDDVMEMEDDTYDLAIANLVLGERVADWRAALREMLRVVKPGGQVMCTVALYGSWAEVEDLFEELLRDSGMRPSIAKLNRVRRMRPRPHLLAQHLEDIGLTQADYILEQEQFSLLFRSGRELLFAPVVEHGPLRLWKAILSADAGDGVKPQELFWRFKENIDTYYSAHVLGATIRAGFLRFRKPATMPSETVMDHNAYANRYWSRFPSLDAIYRGEVSDDGEDDIDIDLDVDLDLGDDEDDVEGDARTGAAVEPDAQPEAGEEFGDPIAPLEGLLAVDDDLQLDESDDLDAGELVPDPVRELLEEVHAASSGATGRLAAINHRELAPLPIEPTGPQEVLDDEIEELDADDLLDAASDDEGFSPEDEDFEALFERSFHDLSPDGPAPTPAPSGGPGSGETAAQRSPKRKPGAPPPPPPKKKKS